MAEGLWRVKRGDTEYDVEGPAMLRQWAEAGNLTAEDYVFNPVLQQWMYARDVAEIQGIFGAKEARAKNENLNRTSWGLGCLGFLVLFAFPPAGVVLIIIAVVMSAFYHLNRGK